MNTQSAQALADSREKSLQEVKEKEFHYAPKVLGWEDIKLLYLANVQVKQISRLSGFSESGIAKRADKEGWALDRQGYSQKLYDQTLKRWGQDAQQQANELMVLQGRLAQLAEGEISAWEQKPPSNKTQRQAARDKANILSSLASTITQAQNGLRLLIGQSTQRTENLTLSQLVVELRSHGYGEAKEPQRFKRDGEPS